MDHEGVVVPFAWIASLGGVMVTAACTMWYALQKRSDAHVADIKDMHSQAMQKMQDTTTELTEIKNLLSQLTHNTAEANNINRETMLLLKGSGPRIKRGD